ncbi:MAG TPA: iron-containing alcohol dehydrogenase family protein [Stellaceae bacterium]|nr:iron-containing alcohol dehydrogenase family protein [Stellaceae bacterium]
MKPILVECWPNRLILGRGAVAMLPQAMTDLGARRALVLCGKSIAAGGLLPRVTAALGELCCGVFAEVAAHSPVPMIERAVDRVRALGADAIVSLGGGSAIDAGKGTALLHAAGGALGPYEIEFRAGRMERRLLETATLPHIAIPTTTGSSSEVLPTAGIRDVARRRKMLFWDAALVPRAVILDPEMTIETGAFLTAASGMTAVARCVESLYSAHRNPLSEGLALHALRLLRNNLPRTVAAPDDLDARQECQIACAMSGIASVNAMASIVHALGHIVGGRYALQHGVSHAILLAPAMRLLLPVLGERQAWALEALGGDARGSADAAGAAAEQMEKFVAGLPLKRRLRDLGIPATELPEIAALAMHDYMMGNLPRPMSAAEVEALLHAAW